jgi:RNA polymerase sigma factor (TIGR02999 family)
MRQILVDHARRRNAAKRGGGAHKVELRDDAAFCVSEDVDILALDEALDALQRLDERQARVVELRFYAGMTVEEIARALDVSPRTVNVDWRMARAWLQERLEEPDG